MYRKNVASQFFCFQGVDATTGGIKSGVSWTIRRCIDGTFAAATGTVSEDGTTGWYKMALSQADTNGNDISFNFTGSGAVPQTVNILTTACDPSTATNFGITALPATAVTTNASLLTSGSGTDQLLVSSGKVVTPDTQKVDVNTIKTQAITCAAGVTILANVGFAGAPGAANGGVFCGSNAATTFDSFTVTNAFTVSGATVHTGNVSMAAGLTITQSSSNASALVITGNGTGHGILCTSGAGVTGNGALFVSNSTNGDGIKATGKGTGNGMDVIGGAAGNGLLAQGGVTSGSGFRGAGTGTSAHGMYVTGTTGGNGFTAEGSTTGDGMELTGGDTGRGLHILGGATSGAAIRAEAQGGNANGAELVHNGSGADLLATLVAANFGASSLNGKGDWLLSSSYTAPPSAASIATAVLTTQMTEAYTTGAFTLSQALYEIAQALGQFSIVGTTLTMQKRDLTTAAGTFTLDSATAPTSRTRAS